jgi:hypothetical protein
MESFADLSHLQFFILCDLSQTVARLRQSILLDSEVTSRHGPHIPWVASTTAEYVPEYKRTVLAELHYREGTLVQDDGSVRRRKS